MWLFSESEYDCWLAYRWKIFAFPLNNFFFRHSMAGLWQKIVSSHSKQIHCQGLFIVLTNCWYSEQWSTALKCEIARNYSAQFFSLLFIFNSNQKEQLFVWPTKCVVEELKGNTWYFSKTIEKKSSAQFSETSMLRRCHESTPGKPKCGCPSNPFILARAAELMDSKGNLKGWLSLKRVNELITMWKNVQTMEWVICLYFIGIAEIVLNSNLAATLLQRKDNRNMCL